MDKPTHVRVTVNVHEASRYYLDALESGRHLGLVVKHSAARLRIEFADEAIEWHPAATVGLHMRGRAIRSWCLLGDVKLAEEARATLMLAEAGGNIDRAEYAP